MRVCYFICKCWMYFVMVSYLFFVWAKNGDRRQCVAFDNDEAAPWCTNVESLIQRTHGRYLIKETEKKRINDLFNKMNEYFRIDLNDHLISTRIYRLHMTISQPSYEWTQHEIDYAFFSISLNIHCFYIFLFLCFPFRARHIWQLINFRNGRFQHYFFFFALFFSVLDILNAPNQVWRDKPKHIRQTIYYIECPESMSKATPWPTNNYLTTADAQALINGYAAQALRTRHQFRAIQLRGHLTFRIVPLINNTTRRYIREHEVSRSCQYWH